MITFYIAVIFPAYFNLFIIWLSICPAKLNFNITNSLGIVGRRHFLLFPPPPQKKNQTNKQTNKQNKTRQNENGQA